MGGDTSKPMVYIDAQPVLWHIMMSFARQKWQDFIIYLGYQERVIKDYFRNPHFQSRD